MKTLLIYIICSLVPTILFQTCSMKLLPYAFEEEDYLKNRSLSSDIYQENSEGVFYNPFNFSHDDCGRLLLISTNEHTEIETVELIVQDNNKGAVVVIYYHDGRVENYISCEYSSNKEYVKLDSDWEIIGNQDFDFVFTDTPKGMVLKLDVTVRNGTTIQIDIQENCSKPARYNVLATIGDELHQVKRFPLIYMNDMTILPADSALVSFEINGEVMAVPKIPIKVEGKTCYRIIYSLERIPFFWNEELEGEIKLYKIIGNTLPKELEGYTFSASKEHKEIESIVYQVDEHTVSLKFLPAFPDVVALKDGAKITGKFSMGVDEITGVIGGIYSVRKAGGQIEIDLKPELCWGSVGKKNWVAKYSYNARIVPAPDNKLEITSEWTVN